MTLHLPCSMKWLDFLSMPTMRGSWDMFCVTYATSSLTYKNRTSTTSYVTRRNVLHIKRQQIRSSRENYTMSQYKRASLLLSISLPIIYRFSKFFRWHTLQTICNNVITTLCPKKRPTLWLSISSPNTNQFSKFFHWYILWIISNKVITEHSATH